MRLLSALAAFLFVGFITGMALLLFGDATGWMTVHGGARGPLWWRVTYLAIFVLGTPIFAFVCAMKAWRQPR